MINDYLINPNKVIKSPSCFKIFFDACKFFNNFYFILINFLFFYFTQAQQTFIFKLLTNEKENLILYKKITAKFPLKEKNLLYLGSYLISMEICFENNPIKDNEKETLKSKNTFAGKIIESRTTVSEKE